MHVLVRKHRSRNSHGRGNRGKMSPPWLLYAQRTFARNARVASKASVTALARSSRNSFVERSCFEKSIAKKNTGKLRWCSHQVRTELTLFSILATTSDSHPQRFHLSCYDTHVHCTRTRIDHRSQHKRKQLDYQQKRPPEVHRTTSSLRQRLQHPATPFWARVLLCPSSRILHRIQQKRRQPDHKQKTVHSRPRT